MSDVESVSTISVVDSVMPPVEQAAKGGTRWTPEQMEKLWAHRHFDEEPIWCMKCDCDFCEDLRRTGKMPKENPHYKHFGKKYQKSSQACRLKIHHVKKDLRKGAISLEDALAGKPLPSQRALAKRKQAAAHKRAGSPKDASAGKPLPVPTSKPQNQAADEKKARSPKSAFAGKPLPAFSPNPLKKASAEKRASSPEDAVDEEPPCDQASQSREHTSAESRARSPEDSLPEEPRSISASSPRQRISIEQLLCFRSNDGERVASPHAPEPEPEVVDAANTLLYLSAGSWGSMTVEQRSHVLGEQSYNCNIQPDQE